MKPLVIAHRTCPRDSPENSLVGIAKAAELNADVVEIDVRRSADGMPMLLHDRWLFRTTGRARRVDSLGSHKISGIGLRGGGTVPTLAEALAALGPTLNVAIDVKDCGAADAVISEVRNQHLETRVLFWSQHEQAVRTAFRVAPELEISLLRDTSEPHELEQFLRDALAFGARGVSAHWSQVSPHLAERCAEADIRLYAWCKSKFIDAEKLALVHGLVTDWPTAGKAAVQALPG